MKWKAVGRVNTDWYPVQQIGMFLQFAQVPFLPVQCKYTDNWVNGCEPADFNVAEVLHVWWRFGLQVRQLPDGTENS